MVDRVLHCNQTDEWETPQHLFDFINNDYRPFTLDPCATKENAKCDDYFTKLDDGLSLPWYGSVFVNPPYSEVSDWLAKAVHECKKGNVDNIVLLIGARTDTNYWYNYIWTGPVWDITFIRGRLKFGGSNNPAPFPSCLVYMKPDVNPSSSLICPIISVIGHDKGNWNWYFI